MSRKPVNVEDCCHDRRNGAGDIGVIVTLAHRAVAERLGEVASVRADLAGDQHGHLLADVGAGGQILRIRSPLPVACCGLLAP
jgi:hypothetical protein